MNYKNESLGFFMKEINLDATLQYIEQDSHVCFSDLYRMVNHTVYYIGKGYNVYMKTKIPEYDKCDLGEYDDILYRIVDELNDLTPPDSVARKMVQICDRLRFQLEPIGMK